jgi:hypothetical protein
LNSGGVLQIKLDGSTVIDYTGDTTSSSEYVTKVHFRGIDAGGTETLWDDIVINDTSGSLNNSWPGQVRLQPIRPVAAGDSTQFTRAGIDLGTNHAQLRDKGAIDAMLQSDTVDELDLYEMDVPDLPAGALIQNVIVMATARIESGSGSLALVAKNGGNTDQGSDQVLTAGWQGLVEVFPTNPTDDQAWAEADLDGLQLGIKAR